MPYGTIKVDTITFTDAGVDKSVTISGLVQNPTFSGNITVTGTVSGNTIQGQTVSGATITGGAAAFTTVTGGVATITSGVFALGSASNPSISFTGDANSGLYSPGADQVAISTAGSHRLRITAEGNVGIGTTTPDNFANYTTLDVRGTTGGILQTSNGAQKARLYVTGGGCFLGAVSNDPLIFNTNDTERLRITSAGLVGIGTSSPAQILHCTTANGTASQLQFTQQFQREYRIGVPASSTSFELYDVSAGASRLTVNSSGNVGIGTTAPTSLGTNITTVEIQGATTTRSGGIRLSTSDSSQRGAFYVYDGVGILGTETSHPLGLYVGNTERARIDTSGRLLVGTSSSVSTFGVAPVFQVAGGEAYQSNIAYRADAFAPFISVGHSRSATVGAQTILQSGDDFGTFAFVGSDGTGLIRGAQISAAVDGTPGANDMPGRLVFSTTADGASSPTERARLDSGGEFNIFAATGRTVFGARSATGAGTTDRTITGIHSATSTTATGTISFQVFTNGNTQNTNNSYAGISDVKLKENIVDAGPQWDDLKALQVRNYNFKEETGHETHTQIGLVAQEAELVSPGLVFESPDRDAEGNDLGTVTKSVNYSVLYMKAVKALQEAMERIEVLEQRLNDAGIN